MVVVKLGLVIAPPEILASDVDHFAGAEGWGALNSVHIDAHDLSVLTSCPYADISDFITMSPSESVLIIAPKAKR